MDIFGVFSLVGGLALFLYGMDIMGKGLEKLSGGRLERLLEKLTSNRIKAVALGTKKACKPFIYQVCRQFYSGGERGIRTPGRL